MSNPEYDPRKVPNFTALKEHLAGNPSRDTISAWVAKLEEWANVAVAAVVEQDNQAKDAAKRIDDLEHDAAEARDAAEELEQLEERILDITRGVVTVDELVDEISRT